jgi:molecular chaperone GrpE
MTVRVPIVDRRSSQSPATPIEADPQEPAPPSAPPPEPPAGPSPVANAPADGHLAVATAERDEWRDRALRAAAELENLRRLVDQRVEAEVFRRERERLERWLELGDALDRARALAAGAPAEWTAGLDEVARLFDDLMRKAGASRIDPGEIFDPQWHEALCAVADTGKPDGAIVDVVRAGWKLGDRLLRPAGVTVARGSAS